MAGKTKVMVAGTAIVTMGLTAACGGGSKSDDNGGSGSKSAYNAAITGVVNPSDKKGGTLNLWTAQDVDSMDPAVKKTTKQERSNK